MDHQLEYGVHQSSRRALFGGAIFASCRLLYTGRVCDRESPVNVCATVRGSRYLTPSRLLYRPVHCSASRRCGLPLSAPHHHLQHHHRQVGCLALVGGLGSSRLTAACAPAATGAGSLPRGHAPPRLPSLRPGGRGCAWLPARQRHEHPPPPTSTPSSHVCGALTTLPPLSHRNLNSLLLC
jgi:hypothetical protein